VNLIVRSHARTVQDAYEREDDTIIADDHIILYIDEWEYLAIVADSRLWRYFSFRTYFACHNYYI
jgi:hypothetical protein